MCGISWGIEQSDEQQQLLHCQAKHPRGRGPILDLTDMELDWSTPKVPMLRLRPITDSGTCLAQCTFQAAADMDLQEGRRVYLVVCIDLARAEQVEEVLELQVLRCARGRRRRDTVADSVRGQSSSQTLRRSWRLQTQPVPAVRQRMFVTREAVNHRPHC